MCETVGKADLLSAHLDDKQSRDPVDQPSTSYPRLSVVEPVSSGSTSQCGVSTASSSE